ncbi:MAG: ribosome biogenesis GTPase Der [Bacteroidetes bacterium]|nr:MAG: ribosome biogenesis GTPase Der [Bacteroidota bacterium]
MPVIVSIIGRPNVGKSTIFNRLTKTHQAIVDETPGVTRDRNYGTVEWRDISFTIIDTGGYMKDSDDVFEKYINRQVHLAIEESHIILLVVDAKDGITEWDKEVANVVRKHQKPVLLVANKVDNSEMQNAIYDFYSLGFDHLFPISAISGSGTGELLDAIKQLIDHQFKEELKKGLLSDDYPKIAILGKPNVGKSSLVNALLGEEKNIVTDIPGTTRDAIHTFYNKFNQKCWLIDTAGLRKKSKVKEDIEFYSTVRTIRAIEQSDVCILMIDATVGIEAQDMHIFQNIVENKKGIVIAVNKWDLIQDKYPNITKDYEEEIKNKTAPFKDLPIVFISAKDKTRLIKLLETAIDVHNRKKTHIPTHELNDFFQEITNVTPPPSVKGKFVKIKYVTQVEGAPIFLLFCNLPQYVSDSYKRFLENKIRERYNFTGVPITLVFKKK